MLIGAMVTDQQCIFPGTELHRFSLWIESADEATVWQLSTVLTSCSANTGQMETAMSRKCETAVFGALLPLNTF